jgi:hypothetical protein
VAVRRPPDGAPAGRSEDADIERPDRHGPDQPAGGGAKEDQMSGTTRTIQQPVAAGFLPAVGMAAAVLAAAVAIAWGSANLGKATTVAQPAPALYAPIVRDLGTRDAGSAANGLAPNAVNDHGSSDAGVRTRVLGNQLKDDAYVAPGLGYHGFGPAAPTSTGSNEGASAGRSLAPRAQ